MSEHIAVHYLRYEPTTGHRDGCTRGPNTWEIARYVEYGFGAHDGEERRTSLRMFCPECKMVQIFSVDGHLERRFTDAGELGFGSEPERVATLWLWPGAELLRGSGDGPDCYYVTTHKLRPCQPGQIAGVIGQGRRSARANAARRWYAGLGCTEYGTVRQGGPEDGFSSRTAAAKWLAEQLADRREA